MYEKKHEVAWKDLVDMNDPTTAKKSEEMERLVTNAWDGYSVGDEEKRLVYYLRFTFSVWETDKGKERKNFVQNSHKQIPNQPSVLSASNFILKCRRLYSAVTRRDSERQGHRHCHELLDFLKHILHV